MLGKQHENYLYPENTEVWLVKAYAPIIDQ